MINEIDKQLREKERKKFDKGLEEFEHRTNKILNRISVNYIICRSSNADAKKWTFKNIEAYLTVNNTRKLTINQAYLVNSLLTKKPEYDLLKNLSQDYVNFITEKFELLCNSGEYIYQINALFRKYIKKIDEKIESLN